MMSYSTYAYMFIVLFPLAIAFFIYVGMRLSKREKPATRNKSEGLKILEGALFALMGLLIAFTFNSAHYKFDLRRQLIIEEANNIGTAYLRLDLIDNPIKTQLQEYLRQYLSSRLATYRALPDVDLAMQEMNRTNVLQHKIWDLSVHACKTQNIPAICIVLLPALNSMFDIANTRYANTKIHPPWIIFVLLIGVSVISSFLAGFDIGIQSLGSRIFLFSYAILIALTIYIVIDMEFPRLGLIRVDSFDQVLIDVGTSMKQ